MTLVVKCDKDDDGVLSKTEFHSMIHRNKAKNPTVEKGDRMFEDLDANKVSRYRKDGSPLKPFISKHPT